MTNSDAGTARVSSAVKDSLSTACTCSSSTASGAAGAVVTSCGSSGGVSSGASVALLPAAPVCRVVSTDELCAGS